MSVYLFAFPNLPVVKQSPDNVFSPLALLTRSLAADRTVGSLCSLSLLYLWACFMSVGIVNFILNSSHLIFLLILDKVHTVFFAS